MKRLVTFFLFMLPFFSYSKEWKNLEVFIKETKLHNLPASDWLKSDRINKTSVWYNANKFNLNQNRPQDYKTIKQRRDFYFWYVMEIETKGHEIIWPKMAHFISDKLKLIKGFPFNIFTTKNVKNYAYQGSQVVFNMAFPELKIVYNSTSTLKADEAYNWDKNMLYDEQHLWLESIYKTIDKRSVKQIERMAKGKFLYGLVVKKAIRFKGDISNPKERFDYAMNTLRLYCMNTYE